MASENNSKAFTWMLLKLIKVIPLAFSSDFVNHKKSFRTDCPFIMSIPQAIVMNKKFLLLILSSLSLVFFSCEDDTDSIKEPVYRPVRIEEVAYKRELVYNASGQVVKVVSESEMPDKELISTVQEFEYRSDGKIISSMIDNQTKFNYTYDQDRIVKTEQVESGVPLHRFVFAYQTNGLIKEMLSYKYEGSEPKHTGKIVYAFDPTGNVSSVKEFSFKDQAYSLETIYEYDRYDNFQSADSQFDFHTVNTGLQLHKNNPGRMVSRNKNGVAFSIEDYVYDYSANGIPVRRESTITFLHIGSTGSYETHYFFEEM